MRTPSRNWPAETLPEIAGELPLNQTFSIAIDGPAGAGKSTIARAAAERLGAMYLDTGAMYRAVGLYFLRRGLDGDVRTVAEHASEVHVSVKPEDGVQRIFLNGEDVTEAIRTPEASLAASHVAAVPEVRERMVALQREIAKGYSIVMDGRDIGTKVLPDATLKLYVTASPEVRARRRHLELIQKGEEMPFKQVLAEIRERDYNDTHRAASPLVQAEDAHLLDTSNMTMEQSLGEVERLFREAIGG